MVESKARWKRLIAFMLAFAMVFSSIAVSSFGTVTVQAASKNVKKVTLKVAAKDVTKKAVSVYSGSKKTLKVLVSPSNAKKKVTFKSSKPSVASVTKKGVITGKKKGTAKINVTVTGKDNKKTKTYVNVNVKYVKLSLNKKNASVNAGKSITLKATSTPKKTVKWSTSNKAVATVSSKGVVKGVKAGTATITAAVGQKKATCKVTVKGSAEVAVTEVKASIESAEISVGNGTQITASVLPANATNKKLTYSSSDESVATVNDAGAVVGIGAGKATITVRSANGKTASVEVTVTYVAVSGITIEADSFTVGVTGTTNLTAKVVPDNASYKLVEWSSNNEAVATVDVNGKVTGVAEGTATITAKSTDTQSAVSAQCVITVVKDTDGVTMQLVNPYSYEANGEPIKDTVLYGNDMDILVHVRKGGQPLANANVTLKMAREEIDGGSNDAKLNPYRYEIKGDHNTTDAKGNVHFIIGLKQDYANTTAIKGRDEGRAEVYTLTASEVSSGLKSEIMVNTAQLSTGQISVSSNSKLEPSENWKNGSAKIATKSIDGKANQVYLASQKVSLDGKDTHEVTFTANPRIHYGLSKKAERDDWGVTYPENPPAGQGASGTYSVYNNVTNKTTTTQIQDVPDGIKYITLNFKKINLSKYTKINIDLYYVKENGELGNISKPIRPITYENNTNGKELSVQIDTEEASSSLGRRLVVSVVTKGRVSVSEDGYVLASLKGTWGTDRDANVKDEPLPDGTVKWSLVSDKVTYEQKKLEDGLDPASIGLPVSNDAQNPYNYQYRIPVFPYTGDAFFTVTDRNGRLIGTYAYPTCNQQDRNGKFLNKNDLYLNNGYMAMMITSDEANNMPDAVLDEKGNNAVVNAYKTGMTALKATIDINGLGEDDFNSHNGKELYTSVLWCPVTTAGEQTTSIADYYAIEGQFVTVTAQLLDANNNKASQPNQPINFTCTNNDSIQTVKTGNAIVTDNIQGKDRSVVLFSDISKTDSNGQVKLELLGDALSSIRNLKATNPNYKVGLTIESSTGGIDINAGADIYWVDLGLTYEESALDNEIYGEVTDNLVGTTNKATTSEIMKDWYIGYLPTAKVARDGIAVEVIDADNIPIAYSVTSNTIPYLDANNTIKSFTISSGNASQYLKQSNNVATIHSDRNVDMYLTGKINSSAISTSKDISFKFKVDGKEVVRPNVGKGESQAINNTGLTHTIQWQGANIQAVPSAVKTNVNCDEDAIIKVQLKDSYKNVYKNEVLTCEYVLPDSADSSGLVQTVTTDVNGVATLTIPAGTVATAGTARVTFKGDNGNIVVSQMITYTNVPAAGASEANAGNSAEADAELEISTDVEAGVNAEAIVE